MLIIFFLMVLNGIKSYNIFKYINFFAFLLDVKKNTLLRNIDYCTRCFLYLIVAGANPKESSIYDRLFNSANPTLIRA